LGLFQFNYTLVFRQSIFHIICIILLALFLFLKPISDYRFIIAASFLITLFFESILVTWAWNRRVVFSLAVLGIIYFILIVQNNKTVITFFYKKIFYKFRFQIVSLLLVAFLSILLIPAFAYDCETNQNESIETIPNSYIPFYKPNFNEAKFLLDFLNERESGTKNISYIGSTSPLAGGLLFLNNQLPDTYYWFLSQFNGLGDVSAIRQNIYSQKIYKYVSVDIPAEAVISEYDIKNTVKMNALWENYKPILGIAGSGTRDYILFERKD
jgi:hypothetical protein